MTENKANVFVALTLVCAATTLIAIGGLLTFEPHLMFGLNGVKLDDDPNLLSEVRAPGFLLLLSGILTGLSLFRPRWRQSALLGAGILLIGFAGGRGISLVFDGLPAQSLIAAGIIELALGLVCIVLFQSKYHQPHPS